MSKALEALERIRKMYEYFVKTYRELDPKVMICEKEDFNFIENSLKRLEELEKEWEMEHTLRIRLENISHEKDEVLKIIKEKNIIKLERHKDTNRCYLIYTFDKVQIANDEFDLLKGWLCE